MSPAVSRGFRFAVGGMALGLGAILLWLAHGDPWPSVVALALTAISLATSLGGELETRALGPRNASGPAKADEALAPIVERVLSTLRRFVALQGGYARDLEGVKAGLAQFPSREAVQDIVVRLLNAHGEMEEKVAALTKELEASREQILALKGDIAEVGKIAMIDSLTQLGNRRFFDDTLKTEVERALAKGAPLALALADIDRFKVVNDRFGHVVGDHLLRLVAELLGRQVKGKGHAARYGGEEFALVFPGMPLEEATPRVEAIRRELEKQRWVVGAASEKLGAVTASFGVAELAPGDTPESLVKRADDKLLAAKATGRNRVLASPNVQTLTPRARARSV